LHPTRQLARGLDPLRQWWYIFFDVLRSRN
jgi:hypothetical protein